VLAGEPRGYRIDLLLRLPDADAAKRKTLAGEPPAAYRTPSGAVRNDPAVLAAYLGEDDDA